MRGHATDTYWKSFAISCLSSRAHVPEFLMKRKGVLQISLRFCRLFSLEILQSFSLCLPTTGPPHQSASFCHCQVSTNYVLMEDMLEVFCVLKKKLSGIVSTGCTHWHGLFSTEGGSAVLKAATTHCFFRDSKNSGRVSLFVQMRGRQAADLL